MESSHLVIFSTSGKFITKHNVLRYVRAWLNDNTLHDKHFCSINVIGPGYTMQRC